MLIKFDLLNLKLPNCLLCHANTITWWCRGQMGPVGQNKEELHVIPPVFIRPDSALHRMAWHWHWGQTGSLSGTPWQRVRHRECEIVRRLVISAAILRISSLAQLGVSSSASTQQWPWTHAPGWAGARAPVHTTCHLRSQCERGTWRVQICRGHYIRPGHYIWLVFTSKTCIITAWSVSHR